MQTLFDLNVIYGYVWDRGVQASCLGTAAGYVPDSLPVLRALMEANVLGLIRSEADTTAYLHMLDSLRRDSRMTEAVPPLGLMVNTDIYRLRGDTSALDSARRYARITEEGAPGHPALWLYDTYRLRYFVDKNQADSARVYAATLDSLLGDETPYASEMVAELIHYSEWAGDSVGAARLRLALRSLEEAREAYGKGQDMAARSMDPRLSAFIDSSRAGRRDRTPLTVCRRRICGHGDYTRTRQTVAQASGRKTAGETRRRQPQPRRPADQRHPQGECDQKRSRAY